MKSDTPWYAPAEMKKLYDSAGSLQRAQADYVASVGDTFKAVITRLGAAPSLAIALDHVEAATLWAAKHILTPAKQEAA